jgi:hypothetical protein
VTDGAGLGTFPANEGGSVTKSLPKTRDELLALHAQARRRRNAAALGGEEHQAACQEIAAIEVRIAEIEAPTVAAAKG